MPVRDLCTIEWQPSAYSLQDDSPGSAKGPGAATRMNISLRQLRYFVAVAECGQITLAAAELGISQPSITEAVQALESEVGVKLLRRHGKGMILTNEGAQFLLQAKRILADVVDAVQAYAAWVQHWRVPSGSA